MGYPFLYKTENIYFCDALPDSLTKKLLLLWNEKFCCQKTFKFTNVCFADFILKSRFRFWILNVLPWNFSIYIGIIIIFIFLLYNCLSIFELLIDAVCSQWFKNWSIYRQIFIKVTNSGRKKIFLDFFPNYERGIYRN
jgi:hypothetical protein